MRHSQRKEGKFKTVQTEKIDFNSPTTDYIFRINPGGSIVFRPLRWLYAIVEPIKPQRKRGRKERLFLPTSLFG